MFFLERHEGQTPDLSTYLDWSLHVVTISRLYHLTRDPLRQAYVVHAAHPRKPHIYNYINLQSIRTFYRWP